jgi:hypothetical protein
VSLQAVPQNCARPQRPVTIDLIDVFRHIRANLEGTLMRRAGSAPEADRGDG